MSNPGEWMRCRKGFGAFAKGRMYWVERGKMFFRANAPGGKTLILKRRLHKYFERFYD